MEQFWQFQHARNDVYWLSFTSAEEILMTHKIDTDISGLKVLDIGIGKGILARYLYNKGNTIYGCDISRIALEDIKDIANVYHTSDLSQIAQVDLAIANLVFQHCNDEEVQRIIREVNLTESGVFSFQFAFLREGEVPSTKVNLLHENGTHHFRSLDTIKDMVHRSNKELVWISDPIHFNGDENISWYIVKIKNA
jgi:SAM-dependent methyltransferase